MSVAELLQAHGIHLHSTAPGRHYAICPQCSAKRSTKANRTAKCLGITVDADGAYWTCNHCAWKGSTKSAKTNGRGRDENLTTYDYVGDDGELLYQKVRNPPGYKSRFWLRQPDGRGGWTKGRGDARRVIYRLPEVIEAMGSGFTIVIVEGEKDCDNLWRIGIPATCNPDGASEPDKKPKWCVEYSEMLRDADIVVTGDDDDTGRAHTESTAAMSIGIAARVRVLDAKHWHVPPKGKDVSDCLAAGHSREEFDALIEREAKPWTKDEGHEARAPEFSRAKFAPRTAPAPISSEVLRAMTFDPIKYVVPGIIVEGLTLFAGKPKLGKSWLLLHAAIAVARSGFTLGEIHCPEGDVLYCALEDNPRRLKSRMAKLMPDPTTPWPKRLAFLWEMPRLSQGGLIVLKNWILGIHHRPPSATQWRTQIQHFSPFSRNSAALHSRPRAIVRALAPHYYW
jgi:hypothetical protein